MQRCVTKRSRFQNKSSPVLDMNNKNIGAICITLLSLLCFWREKRMNNWGGGKSSELVLTSSIRRSLTVFPR